MSSTIVRVCRIDDVRRHNNSDNLDLAVVGGWQTVVKRDTINPGDLVTYFPPDSVLPEELSDRLGVTKYLSKGRVRAARLRGEPSFGFVCEPLGEEGENVAEKLGVTKYQPPIKLSAGDAEAPDSEFPTYTDIENLRNFTDILVDGEEVIVTEKIHGTNCRIGILSDGRKVAGSREVQRKESPSSTYWFPWSLDGVRSLMDTLYRAAAGPVALFGEVYGKVQSLRYGVPNGIAFRAFDISMNGIYIDQVSVAEICQQHGVEFVPTIYRGRFSIEKVRELSSGPSLIPNANHIREGVVVQPVVKRTDPRVGRVILKYVSDDYLLGNYE